MGRRNKRGGIEEKGKEDVTKKGRREGRKREEEKEKREVK